MKKRLFSVLLAVIMLVSVICAISIVSNAAVGDTLIIDGIRYKIDKEGDGTSLGTASISSAVYNKEENTPPTGSVVIPETIEYQGNTYEVTYLGWGSFEKSGVTQLYLPASVKSAPSGSAHNPVFIDMDPGCVVYYTNPALGGILKGGNKGGGCSFDKTAALAYTNGGVPYGSIPTDVDVLASNFARENCSFIGWFNNPSCNGILVNTRPTAHIENERYYALWQPNAEHAIVMYDSNFGSVDFGETIDCTTTSTHIVAANSYSATDYIFKNWQLSVYENGQWVVCDTVEPGTSLDLVGGTLYKLTAQWKLDPSIFYWSENIETTYEAWGGGPSDGMSYYRFNAQSKASGITAAGCGFKWYKHNGSDWIEITQNVNNGKNGTYISSILSFPGIVNGEKIKCILTTKYNGVTYLLEKVTTITINPAPVTITAMKQTVSKGSEINTTPSSTNTGINIPRSINDLSKNTVYEKTQLALADGNDTSTPGVYENAIVVKNVSLDSITNAQNYNFSYVPGTLIVKGTPEIIWNTNNVYEYYYTGAKVDVNIEADYSKDIISNFPEAPEGSIKIQYNGSDTVPTTAGTYTVTAVYTPSNGEYYDSCTVECPTKLVIKPADLSISIKSKTITLGSPLPTIGADDLVYSSPTMNTSAINAFKNKIAAAIREGTLTFKFKNGNQDVMSADAIGAYTISAVIDDVAKDALDANVNVTFNESNVNGGENDGTLFIKKLINVTMEDMTATFIGDRIPYDTDLVTVSEEVALTYMYLVDGGWQNEAPIVAGEYTVKATFSGDETYASVEQTATLTIESAKVTIKAKDKGVARGDDLGSVEFGPDDVEVIANDPLTDEAISYLYEFVDALFQSGNFYPVFTSSGMAQNDIEDDVTFVFVVNGTPLTLDALFETLKQQLHDDTIESITPTIAQALGLPSFFQNTNLYFEKGDLTIKEKVNISFAPGGFYTSLKNVDGYDRYEIYNVLTAITEDGSDKVLTDCNVIISGVDGKPAPTGDIKFEYCSETDDYYDSSCWFAIPSLGNYYAKITVSEDENYAASIAYVLVSVKAELIITAKDQTIFPGDLMKADSSAITIGGAMFDADPDMKEYLESLLSDLIYSGIITVDSDYDSATSVAGSYSINVAFYRDELANLAPDLAATAALFEIITNNGQLTVLDTSYVDEAIEKVKDDLQEKIDEINSALENNTDAATLTQAVNDIAALKTQLENLSSKVSTDYATKAELETAINDAKTAINNTIAELTTRVNQLETNLNTANGKIDTNSSDIATLKTDADALKSWQTQAKDAISTLQNLTASQGASIADLQTAVASLQTAVDAATSNITAAIDRIATLEGKVSALETAKTQLEADIAALQSAVDTKAEAQALTAAINSLNASITEAKAYAESQDAALKTLLEAADATINTAIGELKERVTNLEDGLTAANGKIDTNSSNIETLKADVDALKSWKAEAQAAIDSLESLSATKAELEAAVTELKAALKTANDNISAAIKRIEDLEGKVEDLEKDAEALEKAVSELKAAMTSTTEALAKEIKDLNTALEAAKKTAAEGDAELKKAIETAETALKAAVGELEGRVAVIESVLSAANANINTNTTDIATLKANIKTIEMLQSEAEKTIKALGTLIGTNEENIAELQTSVTKLQESVYAADTKIAAAEARIAVLEGKVEELEGVKNELQASVANLQAALATKADREAVNNAVAALQASISALQSAQNNYIFADMTLKNELTAAINAAKELAISTAKDLVSQSATELRAAIDKKADSATLEAKAAELAEAIVLAETASKAYADAQDALLKEALDAELLAANELIASLGIRMTDAEAAIDALESAVEVLQKVTADDAQALKDAVASLSQALADAKALAAESDTAIETALGLVISEAQKALEAKISDVQSGLNKAIKDLKAADASNADELKKAIKSIEDAMAAAESARDAADNALESKLTEAQTELTRKIAEVQANLDTAKTELGKAIESGDTALGEKIKELNEALEAAKAATEASDVTLKTELTAKIDEADAAIYALIEKLQKELQESNVELNTAIEEGDDELNTQFIISTSVAGVGVAGNIGLLAWIIISKKRRLF